MSGLEERLFRPLQDRLGLGKVRLRYRQAPSSFKQERSESRKDLIEAKDVLKESSSVLLEARQDLQHPKEDLLESKKVRPEPEQDLTE